MLLAGNSETLCHGPKSDILKCFSSHNDVVIDKFDSAIIHDLSILVKSQYVDNIKTFNELSKHLYSRIAKISEGYKRCDVVADRYFPNSLKGNLRKGRSLGTAISFSGDTKLPFDFKDFLGNSENKTNLNQLLVKCFIEEHTNYIQTFVVTFNDTVLSNQQCLYDDEDISNCSIEEADQRLVRHAYNCIRNEISSISTNDTDVIMLLIANFPIMLNINCGIKLYCLFGLSDNKKTFFINELAAQIGFEKCKGLSFFHTFTGCDTVSSFFKQSKAKFLKCWLSNKYEELTGVFQELSNLLVEVNDKQLDTLSEFVKDVYFSKRKKSNKSLNELRQEMFLALPNMDLRLLPPSKKGLYKHVQRASIQAGWINRECIGNVARTMGLEKGK